MQPFPQKIERPYPDFSTYDYFSAPAYGEDVSKLNLYYRGLIEDLQAKFYKSLDKERMLRKEIEERLAALMSQGRTDVTVSLSDI